MSILSRWLPAVFEPQVQLFIATTPIPRVAALFDRDNTKSVDAKFRMPMHERMGLAVLDSVVMAVSIGGFAFTLFVAYSILK